MRFLPFLLIYAAVLLLYYPTFGVYFSQDDFFQFRASITDGSLREFIKLFGFPSFEERGYAFYRPIWREALHNIYYSIFGLDVLPMRILSFGLHFANIFLVYKIMSRLFAKKEVALVTAFFFGISAAQVATLYYLAGGVEIFGGAFFAFLSVIFFARYLEEQDPKKKYLSFVFYLLALGSQELVAFTPLLLAGLIFLQTRSIGFLKKSLQELWIYLVVFLIYIYLDVFKIGFPQQEEQYRAVYSIKSILNSLAWYTAWTFGVPQMLVDFVRPGLALNPSLLKHWSDYFYVIFPTFALSLFAVVISSVYVVFTNPKRIFNKTVLFLVMWFLVGLSPMLLLPTHKSTHYLTPVLPAFFGLITYVVFSYWEERKGKSFVTIFVVGGFFVVLFLLSLTSARLGSQTFSAANRGRAAMILLSDLQMKYPTLPEGSVIYFRNDLMYPFISEQWGGTSKQAAFVLNNSEAIQLLYKDTSIKVFYEDLGGLPAEYSQGEVVELVARLR